jgi:hypothetical protein
MKNGVPNGVANYAAFSEIVESRHCVQGRRYSGRAGLRVLLSVYIV